MTFKGILARVLVAVATSGFWLAGGIHASDILIKVGGP